MYVLKVKKESGNVMDSGLGNCFWTISIKHDKMRAVAAQTARSRCKFRYASFRDYRHTQASRLLESESVDSSIKIVISAT